MCCRIMASFFCFLRHYLHTVIIFVPLVVVVFLVLFLVSHFLFLVSHVNFLFVPCGGLSWLPVSFLLHVKYTLSYRM